MRIIVMGQQAFGKSVAEALLAREEEVIAVFCAPDKAGRPEDPLKAFAVERGISVCQPRSYKDPETLAEIRALAPDLTLMAFVTAFVPVEARDIPIHGSLCFHPSVLPLHRGPSSINWPIMWGEKKTGLTVFYPDDGLDEGDILLQKEVEIGNDDTLGTLYFERIFPLGVEAMVEAVDLMRSANPPRIKQDESKATYESWCRTEHAEIDWAKPVGEVYNLIRGTNPQPGAWTRHAGRTLQIFDCAKSVGESDVPGEVTDAGPEGFMVSAGGGQIQVKRVRPEGDKKVSAAAYAAGAGLAPGSRLG